MRKGTLLQLAGAIALCAVLGIVLFHLLKPSHDPFSSYNMFLIVLGPGTLGLKQLWPRFDGFLQSIPLPIRLSMIALAVLLIAMDAKHMMSLGARTENFAASLIGDIGFGLMLIIAVYQHQSG